MNKSIEEFLKMNQKDLARILGVTQGRISQILKDKNPTIRMMAEMAKVSGLPLRDIVGYFYEL